jgi:hypothetical protein
MARSLRFPLLALATSLAACSSVAGPTQKTLTFAQMQALNPGVEGDWILSEYPIAREVRRRPDGTLERLGYWVTDPQGDARPLMLHFDATGVLERKQYGGPLLRPPPPNDVGVDLGFG